MDKSLISFPIAFIEEKVQSTKKQRESKKIREMGHLAEEKNQHIHSMQLESSKHLKSEPEVTLIVFFFFYLTQKSFHLLKDWVGFEFLQAAV